MKVRISILLVASILLVVGGLGLVVLSFSNMYDYEKKTDQALVEAKQKISVDNVLSKEQAVKTDDVLPNEQAISFNKGEVIGLLTIPSLKAELPIIEGTNEEELEKGVGHYSTTVLPGQNDQILLSGHRDTVFRRLGELELGDIFRIEMPYGEFTYQIINTKIVDANDTTVIQSTAPNEILTVSTCYPFSYLGNAPQRYILTAEKIKNPTVN
ncbi:class D sortase [Peribacillus alkalitolerans]|uniref:class D sortase n=1 Tax=Peribacillus alkalitolerans TaxID=1550385 RepID=UPI0013D36F38|nr:class D sortase [Peribacillus alkalitolerans]